MQLRTEIEGHTSKLAYIAMNYQGTLCATASEKGTVIRVFSLPEGNKLFTFKRGLMAANTYQLSFSLDSELLLSCSDTGSVHIYNINRDEVRETNN